MMAVWWVALGGAIGAVARYLAMNAAGAWLGRDDWPYGTLFVNVAGSFLMGAATGALAHFLPERGRELQLFFAVGVLGGFTTFSAFSLDLYMLLEKGNYMMMIAYAGLSVCLSLLALMAGLWMMRVAAA